ncbi:MAG: GYF domain-containing protein [Pirellulales bacterium]
MSELTWYCRVGEQQIGPLTLQQLRRLAAKGELKLTSLVRRSDVASWTEAGQIPDLWPRAAALPPDPTDATARPTAPSAAPPTTLPLRAPQSPLAAQPRPLAPPHAPRPQVVPAQAVQPAQPHVAPPPPPHALPSGIPLTPGHAPASPSNFPVGAVFPGSPVVRPVNAPVPVTPGASQRDSAEGTKTKQQLRREQARRKLLILLSIAGGFLLVLIFTAIFVATRSSKPTVASNSTSSTDATAASTTVTPAAAPPAVAAPRTPATSPASATPASPLVPAPGVPPGTSETGTTAADSSAPPASPSPTMPGGAEFDALVASVRPWRTVNSVSSPTARIQWVGAWLTNAKPNPTQPGGQTLSEAGAATPAKVDDAAPSATAPSPPDATPADTTPPSIESTPRYLCVELRVTVPDRAAAPVNYSGWNTLSTKASLPTAFLVDPAGKPLAFIPPNQFADASRQTKAIRIKPGQVVSDLLVFAAPTGDFEHVRLGLKMSVLGQGDRYLGFQLTRESIANERPVELAESPTTRARPTAAVAAQEEMAGDAPSMPATEASPKPPREETILDLKKQIEEMAKETKAAKDRERKKQEEEEKKKSDMEGQKNESP